MDCSLIYTGNLTWHHAEHHPSRQPLRAGNTFTFAPQTRHHAHKFYSGHILDGDSYLITKDECDVDLNGHYVAIMIRRFTSQGRPHRQVAFRSHNRLVWTTASRGSRHQYLIRVER